jgi:hypothetical protein
MSPFENNSLNESLANKFKEFSRSFIDDVCIHFDQGNGKMGKLAFESWEHRLMHYLQYHLPDKTVLYLKNKTLPFVGDLSGITNLDEFMEPTGNAALIFIANCIDEASKGYLNDYYIEPPEESLNVSRPVITNSIPKIFISHSTVDDKLAELIVDLLRSALNLKAEDIRCTSVEGYRLHGGDIIDDQLRKEILETPVVVGILSNESFASAWVLFELGARWGNNGHLIPLLVSGMTASELKGPILKYSSLSSDNSSQLHQLITDVAKILDIEPESPNVYQKKIEAIQGLSRKMKQQRVNTP